MTTKQNTFDITIMKFDDKTTPYPSATQQGLIDELFDQAQPLEDKVEDIKTLTRASTSNNQTNANSANDDNASSGANDKSFTMANNDNGNVSNGGNMVIEKVSSNDDCGNNVSMKKVSEKVSHTPVDKSGITDINMTVPSVDNSSNGNQPVNFDVDVDGNGKLTIQKKVVHTQHSDVKKRGRPRKLPTPVISSKNSLFSLKKDSICYLKLYSQNLTREDLQAYLSLNPKMTIAEEVAVDLLTGVINKNPKDIDRYWQIVQKAQKPVDIPAQAQSTGNNTLMDSILTEVEGVVFGEVVDESETAC